MPGASLSENKEKRPKPVIFGCSGTTLTATERSVFASANPFGFILFKRNCISPEQVRSLISELKDAVGRDDIAIAIDQEGGRVARLQPPHWPKYPAARSFGRMYERDPAWGIEAVKLFAKVLSYELVKLGITINCAPVADLFNPEGSPAIGDRAFSAKPSIVAALARAEAEAFLANGIMPVIKHIPGHGKMRTDPHLVLPIIKESLAELEEQDFVPFAFLKDLPLGMNSHAVFAALDPKIPASLSSIINKDIIRDKLGFEGLLLSDDLTMKALKGGRDELAVHALKAGADIVLHCNGEVIEMGTLANALEPMNDTSWARWERAKVMVTPINANYDPFEDSKRLDILLGGLEFDNQ